MQFGKFMSTSNAIESEELEFDHAGTNPFIVSFFLQPEEDMEDVSSNTKTKVK